MYHLIFIFIFLLFFLLDSDWKLSDVIDVIYTGAPLFLVYTLFTF